MSTRNLLGKLHRFTIVRYVITGCFLVSLDTAIFLTGVHVLLLSIELSQIIARTAGAVTGFVLHKYYSFDQKRTNANGQRVWEERAGYGAIAVMMIMLSPFLVKATISVLGDRILLGKLLSEAMMFLGTFFLTRLVFKGKWRV